MKRSLTASLVEIRDGGLKAVDHAEAMLDEMGLLKTYTKAGRLHTDRVVQSIKLDRKEDQP